MGKSWHVLPKIPNLVANRLYLDPWFWGEFPEIFHPAVSAIKDWAITLVRPICVWTGNPTPTNFNYLHSSTASSKDDANVPESGSQTIDTDNAVPEVSTGVQDLGIAVSTSLLVTTASTIDSQRTKVQPTAFQDVRDRTVHQLSLNSQLPVGNV